ncbi:hypothetical protein SpCBS45565_g00260 [Spizellomyces sp. 'palustris']|nr:hypothetical protein SpCBS45565_g00260 [Spizellomyces sp. 'palustris']
MPVDIAPIRLSTSSAEPDPDTLESQVRQLKKELKDWEHAFASKEGRKPEKADITANKDIARRYKTYIKLKSSLESSPAGDEKTEKPIPRSKSSKQRRPATRDDLETEGTANEEDVIPLPTVAMPKPPPVANKVPRSAVRKAAGTRALNKPKSRGESTDDPFTREVTSDGGDDSEAAAEQQSPIGSTTLKANFLDKETVTAIATSTFVPEEHLDTSLNPSTAIAAEARPWGATAALPENFKLRRNTVSVGPISTATLSAAEKRPASRPETASEERRSTFSEGSRPVTSAGGLGGNTANAGSLQDNFGSTEASEFLDFMNRRKEIEKITSTQVPAGAVTAAEALKAMQQRPNSPNSTSPMKTDRVRAPIVTSITVQQSPSSANANKSSTSPSIRTIPPSQPLTAAQLRELAKPYDPTDVDFEDDTILDTPVHATDHRISASSPTSRRSDAPKPPKRKSLAFVASPQHRPHQQDVEDGADEEEEANAGDVVAPLATSPMNPQTMCVGADAIGSAMNPSLTNAQIFYRIPPEHILRCKLYRKKNILDKAHPTFFLYNQVDDTFLLAARKRKKSKSVNYVISTSQVDMSKDSKHYVAKLKANFQRTNFILLDARSYNPRASNKGLKELACVSYSKTVLPREMSVAIPATHIEELSEHYSKDIMADVKTQNTNKLLFLRNKPPRWNEVTQSHCLNFGGRVTQPSIKNFQLVGTENENFVIMQFGRCGPDYFTLDVRYPMTPLDAFAVALTTFDAYDNA